MPTTEHVLLVLATSRPPLQTLEVLGAFRLFGEPAKLTAFNDSAMAAFFGLLDRFGVPVRVGTQEGLFIARETIPLDAPTTAVVGTVAQRPEKCLISAVTRAVPPDLEVSWAFAIDTGRYRESLKRKR